MFKTVFEENLDTFFYGETCKDSSYNYSRESEGLKFNTSIDAKVALSNSAAGVLVAVSLLAAPANVSSLSATVLRCEGSRIFQAAEGYSPQSHRIDERGRQELVKKLIKTRDYFNLTQGDLALLLNISSSTLSKLERGEHFPDYANQLKYTKFLELADYLKEKLGGKKYAIRQLFKDELKVFSGMTPVEFSHAVGEEGLNEVYSKFKRLYG